MWSKFGKSFDNLNFIRISPEKWGDLQEVKILERWTWFKFNNLGLAVGMASEFYTSFRKG